MKNEDDIASALGSLPVADIGSDVSRRILGRAHTVLGREQRLAERPFLRRAARFYDGTLEPALAATACCVYLYWAVNVTLALLH